MRNILDKSCGENQNTHFTFIKFSKNHAIYEIMWKYIYVRPDRPQMIV